MKYADYNERKRHGSPELPLQYYHIDVAHPEYVMVAHWHREFEIIRVLEGSFLVHLNNVEYSLSSGDILLVGCGVLHTGVPSDCVYECLVFDMNMLKGHHDRTLEKYVSPIVNSQIELASLIRHEHKELFDTVGLLFDEASKEKEGFELSLYAHLYKMVALLYSLGYFKMGNQGGQSKQAVKVMEIINWIEKNFTEPIALERLCELTGLSKKYICRLFKEYTSKTLTEYINELRIENACYEMSEKGQSITSAAFNSGFNDLSYFCKLFKRNKGMTPKEYKKLRY